MCKTMLRIYLLQNTQSLSLWKKRRPQQPWNASAPSHICEQEKVFVYGSLLRESWPDGPACPAVISRMLMCVILLITEPRLYKSCHCHLKEVQPCDRSLIKNFCFERFNTIIIETLFFFFFFFYLVQMESFSIKNTKNNTYSWSPNVGVAY